MKRSLLCPIVSLAIPALLVATVIADDPRPLRAEDFAFTIEVISRAPLPYQWVRVRRMLRNVSQHRLGPVLWPDHGGGFPEVRGSDDKTFVSNRAFFGSAGIDSGPMPSGHGRGRNVFPLLLEPGERVSFSQAFPLSWKAGQEQEPTVAPPSPGKYALRYEYTLFQLPAQANVKPISLKTTVEIEVRKPEGDDLAVFQMLEKDQALISALMNYRGWPRAELAPKLRTIVERYPKSSYADDAHFALARGYWGGRSLSGRERLEGWSKTAHELRAVLFERQGDVLKDRNPSGFALMPNALLMKRVDPHFKEWSLRKLHREHADSREWLKEYARILVSAEARAEFEMLTGRKRPEHPDDLDKMMKEEWLAFRKRPPGAPKPPLPPPQLPDLRKKP